jgi:hypothetical protein
MTRPLLALAALALLVRPAPAQTPEVKELNRKLSAAMKDFTDRKAQAREQALRGFDNLAAKARTAPGVPAAARADKVKEVAEARAAFEQSEKFPKDPEYIDVQVKYFTELNKGYKPLSKLFDQLLDQALKAGDKETLEQAGKMKADLDKQLPGGALLQADAQWKGNSYRKDRTERFELKIEKRTGSTFKGHVRDFTVFGGFPEYDVEGTVDGLEVKFYASKFTRGEVGTVRVEALLAGDRLIGTVTSTTRRGQTTAGSLVLEGSEAKSATPGPKQ